MRKFNLLLLSALVMALLGTTLFTQANAVSAQGSEHVGIVVAYTPGESITIVDQSGKQYEFQLASTLKLLPSKNADSLKLGSFVTIIAPNSISAGKQVAAGIVIHPKVPDGWKPLLPTTTPLVKNTPDGTTTAMVIATKTVLPTETVMATATGTPPTVTPTALDPSKATPTATPLGGSSTKVTNESFIQWLTSLLRQVLAGQ